MTHFTRECPGWAETARQNSLLRHKGYENFAANVETALRTRFKDFDHSPSEDHWKGIRAIIQSIEAMALGVARPKYLLSSLPTGMGKTSTLIEATRELIRIGQETGQPVGILILTNTLEQIPVLIGEIGLTDDQYAVRTGAKNEELNSRGVGQDAFQGEGRHNNAQVLFTTQQKLYALTSVGLALGDMKGLAFQGRPRAVRIWDEGILPAQEHIVSTDDIDRLKSPLHRAGFQAQRDALETLAAEMKRRGGGTTIDVPDLQLPDPSAYPDLYDDRDLWIVGALVNMAEGRARLRHDAYDGTTALDYDDILPRDFAPLLVLDASGSLRLSYTMWKAGRHNLVSLPSPGKTYTNLLIRHWDRGAGKTAHIRNGVRRQLAEGVAEAVAEADPGEPILIIVRKHTKPYQAMEEEIREAVQRRMAVEGRKAPELYFLTWGRHLATNDFANIKHVIVVGLLQYSSAQAEAMARAAGALRAEVNMSEKTVDTFHKGEIAHHIFQGVGRGAVRKSVNGDVPNGCQLDIIFSTKGNGASVSVGRDILRKAFPGARIVDWNPIPKALTANEKTVVAQLVRIAEAAPEGGRTSYGQLAEIVGITTVNIWHTLKRPQVRAELSRLGVTLEIQKGKLMRVVRTEPQWESADLMDDVKVARPTRRKARRLGRVPVLNPPASLRS